MQSICCQRQNPSCLYQRQPFRLNLDRKVSYNSNISLKTKSIQLVKEVLLKLPSVEVLNSITSVSIETVPAI